MYRQPEESGGSARSQRHPGTQSPVPVAWYLAPRTGAKVKLCRHSVVVEILLCSSGALFLHTVCLCLNYKWSGSVVVVVVVVVVVLCVRSVNVR